MTFYIVKNRHDNTWLTVSTTRSHTSAGFNRQQPPRLFKTPVAAARAAAWWSRGIHANRPDATIGERNQYRLVTIPQPNRNRDNLIVVSVELAI